MVRAAPPVSPVRVAATPVPGPDGVWHRADIPPAKLYPPAAPPIEVVRTSLCANATGAGSVRLIVVRAPAGFGKTTAMLQVRRRFEAQGTETAWLTLDQADNDATRFLACLSAAVSTLAADAAPGSAVDAMATLAAQAGRFALFLDDFEAIHEPAVLALVRSIIERLPRAGHVVVGSRIVPELGIARLRAHGQLLELDADVLRFSRDETGEYFRLRQHRDLSFDALSRLHQKSEGWITALWLASMAMSRPGTSGDEFVERFSGSNRAVADYLTDDVFARQSPEVREFLTRTSILRNFDASICQALVPRTDAARILRQLDEQNLFLVSLSSDATYRYHSLFSDFLRARLLREHPDDVQRLHLTASGWYESQGRPVPAIDHAIDGGDFPHALGLIEPHAQRFLDEGRMRLLARWFSAMPQDDVRQYPVLQAVAIWALLFTHGPRLAAAELERSGCGTSTEPEVLAHVNAQRPLLFAMQDHYDEANEAGLVSLSRLPTCNAFADSVLCNAMANVFSVMGGKQQAQRLIDDARRGDSTFNRMYAESVEGMLALEGGRLREATACFRVAVSTTRAASHNYTSGNAWAGVLYAGVLYEANDFDRADHLVDVYLPLARDVGLPGHMISGHLIRTRIAFSRGDIEKAFETLAGLEYLGHHRRLPRLVANAKLERGRLLLLQGNAQASKEELDRADDPSVWERVRRHRLKANEIDFLALARIRWEIHFGDPRAALPQLEREITEATSQNRLRRALRIRVLQSLALQRSGDPAAATEVIAAVVRQASAEGFVRLIVDEGLAVGLVIQQFHAMLQDMPAKRSDPMLMEHLQRLLDAFGPLPAESALAGGSNSLIEPMTRKELQVLQLAAEGYSNGAMAEKLALSDSTVRTHLRNISAKLHARNRAEAVAIARRLGVIR